MNIEFRSEKALKDSCSRIIAVGYTDKLANVIRKYLWDSRLGYLYTDALGLKADVYFVDSRTLLVIRQKTYLGSKLPDDAVERILNEVKSMESHDTKVCSIIDTLKFYLNIYADDIM